MKEPTETASDEIGEQRISIRRLMTVNGLTDRQIIRIAHEALQDHPLKMLSIAVVDDAEITLLHERYLNCNRATDVLSFDLRDDLEDGPIEGEVVVSAETARRQASALGVDRKEELLRYVVHGILHLMGYEDHTQAGRRRMRRAENRVLAAGMCRDGQIKRGHK